jgi:hypothetical protein
MRRRRLKSWIADISATTTVRMLIVPPTPTEATRTGTPPTVIGRIQATITIVGKRSLLQP